MNAVRQQRGHLVIGGILVAIGFVAMAASMVMNWRFGWGLATDEMDRWLMAVMHSLVDPAAGALVAAGGLMLAWGWRWQGIAAFVCAAFLVAYSMITVFGFMSERIGQLEAHKAALSAQQGNLKWLQNQRVNMELPRSERRLMREDVKAAVEKLTASVRLIPDRHAVAIAAATGFTVEAVQRGLVMVGSGIAQGIKFSCFGFGFFLLGIGAGRRVQDRKTQVGSDGSSGSGGGEPRSRPRQVHPEPAPKSAPLRAEPDNVRSAHRSVISTDAPKGKLTYEQFRNTIRQEVADGDLASSTRALARQTGWSQTSVVRQARKLRAKANPNVRRFAGNGGGFHASARG